MKCFSNFQEKEKVGKKDELEVIKLIESYPLHHVHILDILGNISPEKGVQIQFVNSC